MQTDSSKFGSGRGRLATVAFAALATAALCLAVFQSGRAGAVTAQERYDRAQNKLERIAGTVDGLQAQVAEDNRRVDSLLGQLSQLRATAATLQSELDAKQAKLDRIEAKLDVEKAHLKQVKSRLHRAMKILSDQLVAAYMSGTPDVTEMVLTSTSWADVVSTSDYAESIQDRNDSVVDRVKDLRNEIADVVDRMEKQEVALQAARDEIADEAQAAAAARDEVETQRAEFLATRDMREQRIAALQDQAGDIEGNLPDLSADPASSSAGKQPAPVNGATAVLGSDGQAAAPAGAPQAVKDVIAAANAIANTPYVWGGGHGSFESSGYDCSGAVSYALHGGGLISSPLDSTGLTTWGEPGEGNWITVYGNSGHAYAVIAGLRWDTSGTGGSGPRWSTDVGYQNASAFTARHPSGL
jgi:septal ring factor EnvC (AmiA/AmiB activator)